MLLLTDRASDGFRPHERFGLPPDCVVVPLNRATQHAPTHSLFICDVAFDSLQGSELAREALQHHRTQADMPLLCLTRDPSHLTMMQARALQPTAILSHQAPPPQMQAVIAQMDAAYRAGVRDAQVRTTVHDGAVRTGAALRQLLSSAGQGQPISTATLTSAGDVVLSAVSRIRIQVWLDMVRRYDDMTYQHCLLVAGLVAAFAVKLGVSLPAQRLLAQAALVHDIGKARIPRQILNKAGPLNAAETEIMRTHPAAGYDMLASQRGVDARILDIVRHHHEYLDGSGYPMGLRGDRISTFVRIVTICDIYAALIERRPYKTPMSTEQALSALTDLGPKLDQGLVPAFHALASEREE